MHTINFVKQNTNYMIGKNTNSKKGFTLIELMVVIAIISILTVILLPQVTGAMKRAKKAACQANLQKYLYQGMFHYVNEKNYGGYPQLKGQAFWEALRTLPTKEDAILAHDRKKHSYYICPVKGGRKGDFGLSDYRGPNYGVTTGTNDDRPIAADLIDDHGDDTINILYFDGKVEEAKKGSAEWTEAEQNLVTPETTTK